MACRLSAFLLSLLVATVAQAGEVQVAVAANFAGPIGRIGEAFTAATGHTLKVSSGATGKFYTQIISGAPFEVLLSADDETPKKLIAEGHAVSGSTFTYAIGRLVLWSAQPGLVDAEGAVLASGRVKHVAIANPKVAPYGAAAMEVIRARGLADTVTPKLVTAESIAQAYQFAFTGNAEVGFVALSQLIGAGPPRADERLLGGAPPKAAGGQSSLPGRPVTGSYWLVPPSLYGEIRQDAVLLKAGAKNPAAAALLAYLKSDAARQLIRDAGYGA
ncbi:molybdate ABC transporter substrate-binding protein [uncultured Piscinibacter sp.]|uniref:molybdate ABC transporter substrate-binding protein n=1 Tax=uncultured Piscinibacter sp. TaxID=1131835 RepID=UPI002633EC52|nr:molybdate ABC transporter substrate-binding protein [uncultured Piscinibacter sp.]